MQLSDIVQTSTACPSQWDAATVVKGDPKPVYIRYRFGMLTYQVDSGPIEFCWENLDPGGDMDGTMTTEQMIAHMEKV